MNSNRLLLLVLSSAALAACGGQKGNVSVSVKAAAVAASPSGGADLKNGIVLDEVRMVVRRIELFKAPPAPDAKPDPAAMDRDAAGEDDRDDFPRSSFGPFPVDVKGTDLQGKIHPAFDADVDAGDYAGARIVVNSLPKGFQTTDAVLSGMQTLRASIAIDGTVDGKAFEFKTPMRVAQRKLGPIQIGKDTKNLTLQVDPTGWFTADDGKTRLDPREARDRGEILENIRCSIRLFRDDDHDGKPDDGDENEPEGCRAPPTPPVTPL